MFPTDAVERLLEDLDAHLKELEARAQLETNEAQPAQIGAD